MLQHLRQYVLAEPNVLPDPELMSALGEHLSPAFVSSGLLDSADNHAATRHWLTVGFKIVQRFASQPFTTQAALLEEFGLDRQQLIQLNSVLRESTLLQELIVEHSRAAKYWQNTILPISSSESFHAARTRTHAYPFRVGIYPAQFCMFHCTFCGRDPSAAYQRSSLPPGNSMLKTLLSTAPTDDPFRFYIAGGLEPLTNPELGEIVSVAAQRGFRLSLYTNAFMLTPVLLQRQPGLWQLDSLRISCYGVDPQTALAVTQRADAFDQVMRNARSLLRLRNERHSPLKVGFNFVVLQGRSWQVLQLIELIAQFNRETGGRQIDFLSLREDYSVRGDQALLAAERAEMVLAFAQIEERRQRDDLKDLHIDYGYSLHPLSRGVVGDALEMVDEAAMRRRGYPQISVVVDLLGDVYMYREAGFLDRQGAERYRIGNVFDAGSLDQVVRDFVDGAVEISALPHDTRFFDSFDHVVTKLLNQADADEAIGIPFENGPIQGRATTSGSGQRWKPFDSRLSHRTLVESAVSA